MAPPDRTIASSPTATARRGVFSGAVSSSSLGGGEIQHRRGPRSSQERKIKHGAEENLFRFTLSRPVAKKRGETIGLTNYDGYFARSRYRTRAGEMRRASKGILSNVLSLFGQPPPPPVYSSARRSHASPHLMFRLVYGRSFWVVWFFSAVLMARLSWAVGLRDSGAGPALSPPLLLLGKNVIFFTEGIFLWGKGPPDVSSSSISCVSGISSWRWMAVSRLASSFALQMTPWWTAALVCPFLFLGWSVRMLKLGWLFYIATRGGRGGLANLCSDFNLHNRYKAGTTPRAKRVLRASHLRAHTQGPLDRNPSSNSGFTTVSILSEDGACPEMVS